MGDGDVKYHLGYASHITSPSGKKIYVKLTPNPSHLEAVDPLVIGYTRGQIDDEYGGELKTAMAILIHGDAAVAGQGIVYEVVQMSDGRLHNRRYHTFCDQQPGWFHHRL